MMAAPAREAASARTAAANAKSGPGLPHFFNGACLSVVCFGADKAKCFLRPLIRLGASCGAPLTCARLDLADFGVEEPPDVNPRRTDFERTAMTETMAIGDLELAGLISSRIC